MQQTVPPPTPPSDRLQRISLPEPSPSAFPRNALPTVALLRSCPNRNGESLLAVPAGGKSREGSKADVLADMRARITALERGASFVSPSSSWAQGAGMWTLGAAELDRHLGSGLDAAALHEVKAESSSSGVAAGAGAGNWAAALGFALRLAVRRLRNIEASHGALPHILWCWPSVIARELGAPYGHGIAALGLNPSGWLFAETARAADALWAMEE